MALVRWEPVRELSSLQSEMNRLFNTFFDTPTTGANGGGARRWVPSIDLVETDEHFVLRADLPGLAEADVSVELEDNVLTVSGERKAEHEDKKEGFYRMERSFGQFRRSLTPPAGAARRRRRGGDRRDVRKGRPRGPHPQARGAKAAPGRHPGVRQAGGDR